MATRIKDVVPAPEKISDWTGCFVRSKRNLSNPYFKIPEGSILQLGSVGINKHLSGLPCPCCGVRVSITVKETKRSFLMDFDFVILEKGD